MSYASDSSPAPLILAGVNYAYPSGGDGGGRVYELSLQVERGGMLAVVGPNGSGKTTLLRLAAGLLLPDSGQVSCCGSSTSVASRGELARKVALVGQQPALGFPYSVIEVVLMGRAPYLEGLSLENEEDLAVAHDAMRATGTDHLGGRVFDSLSSGERQRVSVARALAQQPELLLLDEPGAFLDIREQTRLYDLLEELNSSRGTAVVSVLHDLNLAALYFPTVALLNKGRLHAVGAPAEVLSYATVREVFRTDVYVAINDLTGQLNVLPIKGGAGNNE